MTQMDPDMAFNFLSGGKDVIQVDQLDPRMRGMVERIGPMIGLTGNQISRDNPWAGCFSRTSAISTRRNRGGDHVPYCTPPDAVEPARRRVSNPAGRAGSHRFQQQPG